MEQKYNAFISYRHAEVDSRIAGEIQRSLEHFRIPGPIRRETGMQKINRVFRDKEELPITSDLNDDIARALADSDYLIVICSPRTGESMWVQKEIETFLQTHSRSRVLTVLAEGEPGDVIPEILLSDTVTDPDTGEEKTVLVEPLSCDYRMPLRQARREEFPRLAATIIGCSYDDLRQRQKAYRTRRLIAILAAALVLMLGLTAYFIWSNGQIRENYQMALRNHATYLTAEAKNALDSGDWITAAQLAMAAMPEGDGDERPMLPETELTLSRAIGAYSYRQPSAGYEKLEGLYATDLKLQDLRVNIDGDLLATIDTGSTITAWDTKYYKPLWSCRLQSGYLRDYYCNCGFFDLPQNRLLLWDADTFSCRDFRTGDVKWEVTSDIHPQYVMYMIDEKILAAGTQALECRETATGSQLWAADYPAVLPDGTSMEGAEISFAPGINASALGETDAKYIDGLSPDATMLQVRYYADDGYQYALMSLDLQTREFTFLPDLWTEVRAVYMPDAERAFVLGDRSDAGQAFSFQTFTTNQQSTLTLQYVQVSSGETFWETDLDYYVGSFFEAVAPVADGSVLCIVSNRCFRLDADTGQILSLAEMNAPATSIILQSDAAVYMLLNDGGKGIYRYQENTCTCYQSFDIRPVKTCLRAETRDYGDALVYYNLDGAGDSIRRYSDSMQLDDHFRQADWVMTYQPNAVLHCDGVVVLTDGAAIYGMDPETGELRWQCGEEGADYRLLGMMEDGIHLVASADFMNQEFATVDVQTGEMQLHVIPDDLTFFDDPCLVGNTLYTVESGIPILEIYTELVSFDLTDDTMHREVIDGLAEMEFYQGILTGWQEQMILQIDNDSYWALDPADRSVRQLTDISSGSEIYVSCDHLICVKETEAAVFGPDGGARMQISEGVPLLSAGMDPETGQICLLGSDGRIYVYSAEGVRSGIIDTGVPMQTLGDDTRWQFEGGGRLILYAGKKALIINLQEHMAELEADRGFYIRGDMIYCTRDAVLNGQACQLIAAYTRYTPAELMEMAREKIGNMKLKNPEQYGLAASE